MIIPLSGNHSCNCLKTIPSVKELPIVRAMLSREYVCVFLRKFERFKTASIVFLWPREWEYPTQCFFSVYCKQNKNLFSCILPQ